MGHEKPLEEQKDLIFAMAFEVALEGVHCLAVVEPLQEALKEAS